MSAKPTERAPPAASAPAATPGFQRVVVAVLCALLVPILYFVVNRLFPNFENSRTPYEHLAAIDRVARGLPIYVPFSTEFVPITYPPLYWWLSGWLWRVFGSALFWPRLVSLVSALAFLWLMGAYVWRRTERNGMLALAAPVIIVLALHSSLWMVDITVNALHMALVMGGFYLLGERPTPARAVSAAALLSLGVLAKHTGLAYVVAAAALVAVTREWRALGAYLATAAVLLVGALIGLNAASQGAFYRIIVEENQGPPWLGHRIGAEVLSQFYLGLFALMLIAALVPLLRGERGAWWRTLWRAEYVMAGAGVAVACIAWPKLGSGSSHGFIGAAGLVICGCIGLQHWMANGAAAGRALLMPAIVLLQVLIVFLPAMREYRFTLFDDADYQKYERVASYFRAGKTVFYQYPYLPRVFGQPATGHYGNEACRWQNGRWTFAAKPASLSEPFRKQEFDYVILSVLNDGSDPVVRAAMENYQPIDRLPQHPRGRDWGSMREELLVLKAKRLLAPAVPAPARPAPGGGTF